MRKIILILLFIITSSFVYSQGLYPTNNARIDSVGNLMRELSLYKTGQLDDSLVTIEIWDAISSDSANVIQSTTNAYGINAISSGKCPGTRVWCPTVADSIKPKVITFISIATGDSLVGYQIWARNVSVTTNTIGDTRRLFQANRVVGNAVILMNLVGNPLVLKPNEHLYARLILPINGAAPNPNWNKYRSTDRATSGMGSNGTTITVKYKYR